MTSDAKSLLFPLGLSSNHDANSPIQMNIGIRFVRFLNCLLIIDLSRVVFPLAGSPKITIHRSVFNTLPILVVNP